MRNKNKRTGCEDTGIQSERELIKFHFDEYEKCNADYGDICQQYQCVYSVLSLGNEMKIFCGRKKQPYTPKEGQIIETIENGRMKRMFSCCNIDCTDLTTWILPAYCPWCGSLITDKIQKWKENKNACK